MEDFNLDLGNGDLEISIGWLGGSETCFELAGIASHITNNFLLPFFSVGILIFGH